jgi:hypothetical protein
MKIHDLAHELNHEHKYKFKNLSYCSEIITVILQQQQKSNHDHNTQELCETI